MFNDDDLMKNVLIWIFIDDDDDDDDDYYAFLEIRSPRAAAV